MTRISLVDAYDNRDVIVQIENLKKGKQDKLNAGTGVTMDGNTIDVDTTDLATKVELTNETARLDQKIDDVDAKIPPLASKAELADEVTRLDTKIDTTSADLESRIDASNVKIDTNGEAIRSIEDELGSDALPGTIYYRIAKVEGDVITLRPLVNDSINKVDVEGDASTVYHRALHNSGVVENDALPVASDTKAGVMSASMYVGFNGSIQNLQARMAVLEGVGITYQLTGLPDNATSEQITAAFREQYPNVPLSAGIRAADYDMAKIWQYSGTAWIQLTSINIEKATSTALGVVKGSETSTTNEGKIFVELDGSMTVIGWDTLKAMATAAEQSVDNLEPKVTQQTAKIDALEGDVAANAADITTLKGSSTNHESRISSLETTSSDLTTRMGTAEHDIDTLQASDAQQTPKISALEADMNNVKPRVGQLESDVGTLKTDVNGLKTSKQDELIAGPGISIASDGRTISSSGGQWMIHTSENIDDIMTFQIYDYLDVTGNRSAKITVLKDLKFCTYMTHGPKSKSHSLAYNELELPKGVYQINHDTTGIILMDNTGSRYSTTFIRLTRAQISIANFADHNELRFNIGLDFNDGSTNVSSGKQVTLSNNNPNANAEHPIRVLPDVINARTLATAVGISDGDYSDQKIIAGVLIKYYEGV